MSNGADASRSVDVKQLKVLFLCTHNSARSQIAEALLLCKGRDRFIVASAGTEPSTSVHPMATRVLTEHGIDWSDHKPKGIDAVSRDNWDLIITVCDRARESCPSFPGKPVFAHWSMEDPAEEQTERQGLAFREAVAYLSRRIDLLLSLPVENLQRAALKTALDVDTADPKR